MATRSSPNGGIVALDPITAAETNKGAGGWIGHVSDGTQYDSTSLAVAFGVSAVPVRAGRLTKISVSIPRVQAVAGTISAKLLLRANGESMIVFWDREDVSNVTNSYEPATGFVCMHDGLTFGGAGDWGALTPGNIDIEVWGQVTVGAGTLRIVGGAFGDPGGHTLVVEDLGSYPA